MRRQLLGLGRTASKAGAWTGTRARGRACALLAGAAALGLLAPSIAQAGTTLGQTAGSSAIANLDPCTNAGYSEVQTATSGPPSYAAPTNGVITSWRFMGDDDTNDIVLLRIFRRTTTPGRFMVVGDSTQHVIKPNTLNGPFPTSIAVKAGDLLGNDIIAGSNPPCTFLGRSADVEDEFLPDTTPVGGTESATTTNNQLTKVNISATFKPTACVVPNVKGKKLKAAKTALTAAGCRLGKVTPKGQKTGKVKKEQPKAGTVLHTGGKVNIALG